jgi:hypothetical protein
MKIDVQGECRALQMKAFMLWKSAPGHAKRYAAPQNTVAGE